MLPFRDLNPTRSAPFVTVLLIAANALAFLYEWSLPRRQLEQFIMAYGVLPFEITHGVDLAPQIGIPVYLTIVTSMFLHGGWLHILGNMLYLWIFGNNIEDKFGHVRFLLIYLAWGIVAAFAQVVVDPNSRVPAVGASGAIAGVLGAYLVMFPSARVDSVVFIGIFITTVRTPALFVIGFWIVLQFLNGFLSLGVAHSGDGVAYFAHIGGAVAGVVVGLVYRALNRPRRMDSYGW
ncbi:MAG: rhomboid family intramembrane serine protease [Chloroflexota bacterium]